jgi:hypothetical protein
MVKPVQKLEARASTPLRERDLERHLKNELFEDTPSSQPQPPVSLPELPRDRERALSEPEKEEEDLQLQKAIELLKAWEIFKEYLNPSQQNPVAELGKDVLPQK